METRECPECGETKSLAAFLASDGTEHEVCFRCRVPTVNLGKPSDHPTKTHRAQGLKKDTNPYEKGVPTDERGMPFLTGPDLHPMGQREFDRNRHLIEETRRRNRQAPLPPTPREVIP